MGNYPKDGAGGCKYPSSNPTGPMPVPVKAGEEYFWCSCGISKSKPFCDGSQAAKLPNGVCNVAVTFAHEVSELVNWCLCKETTTAPLCDGAQRQNCNLNK